MKKHIKFFSVITLFFSIIFSCKDIAGKDLKDFVDLTGKQKGQAEFGKKYLIVFKKPKKVFNGKDEYLHYDLYSMNTGNGTEELLIPDCSSEIKYCFFDDNNMIVLNDAYDHGSYVNIDYLNTDSKKILFNITVKPDNTGINFKNLDESFHNTRYYNLESAGFNKNRKILFINIGLTKGIGSNRESVIKKFYKINNDNLYEFDPGKELIESDENIITGYNYKNQKEIFFIMEYHDIPWYNYKSKYEGLYIKMAGKNYKILNGKADIYIGAKPVWIEDGSKFIIGEYLFDAEGLKKEKRIFYYNKKDVPEFASYEIININEIK